MADCTQEENPLATEPRPHSPILLGKHKIPLLKVLTSFVLLAEDIGGSMKGQGICRAIADTLNGEKPGVSPRSLNAIILTLVGNGIFETKGQDYFLTPFGQLVYVTLSEGTCVPGGIDWGKVLGNRQLNLRSAKERHAIFAVMAAELASHFTVTQSEAAAEEVKKLTRQLAAARRRQTAVEVTRAQPLKFAKSPEGLGDWIRAIASFATTL